MEALTLNEVDTIFGWRSSGSPICCARRSPKASDASGSPRAVGRERSRDLRASDPGAGHLHEGFGPVS